MSRTVSIFLLLYLVAASRGSSAQTDWRLNKHFQETCRSIVVVYDASQPLVRWEKPVYPSELIVSKLSGDVWLDVLIGPTGWVLDAVVTRSSHPLFSKAARSAVLKWVFIAPNARDAATCQSETVQVTFQYE